MPVINLPTPGWQTGKQTIVQSFSQGNIVPALIITAVALLFYYNGLQVYFHGEIWWNLFYIEATRGNFYFSGDYSLPRPVECAVEDLIFDLESPLLFHAAALGLHAVNSILVFLILKKVIDAWAGLFGALLFTSFWAHPEVVTYPFGIGEALRAFFLLSCIILFYRYRNNPTRTNYILTLGAFILAIGSRETTAIILPPLLYLVDRYLQIESKIIKPSKGIYIPFIVIAIAWLFFVLIILNNPGGTGPRNALEWYLSFWAEFSINLYLSTITSFNLCSFQGPGSGRLFLIFSFVLSFLPLFDIRIRRCLILLWVGWLITIIPLIPAGMNLRYLYITSAFSMVILATCLYHSIAYVLGRFRLKEAYINLLAVLVISVPVSTNFLYVSRHIEYLKDTGRLSESVLRPVFASSPTGTKLAFINLPYVYEPTPNSGYIGTRHIVWGWWDWKDFFSKFASVYGRRSGGDIYQFTLSELYEGRHPLGPDMPKLSPQEFEKLAVEKDTKVYLFNPRNDTVLDVTGRDYNSLKKLISDN